MLAIQREAISFSHIKSIHMPRCWIRRKVECHTTSDKKEELATNTNKMMSLGEKWSRVVWICFEMWRLKSPVLFVYFV